MIPISKKLFILKIVFLLFLFEILYSQTNSISSIINLKNDTLSLNNSYDKTRIIHNYSGRLLLNKKIFSSSSLFLENNLYSTILEQTIRNKRTTNTFNLLNNYELLSNFSSFITANSIIVSDDKNLGISDIANNKIGIGLDYKIINPWNIQMNLGLVNDKQMNVLENGFYYGLISNLPDYQVDGYDFDVYLQLRNENLQKRTNTNNEFVINFYKIFSNTINEKLILNYSNSLRGFYLPFDSISKSFYGNNNNIEQRSDRNIFFSNQFTYEKILDFIDAQINFEGNIRRIEKSKDSPSLANENSQYYDEFIDERKLIFSPIFRFNFDFLNTVIKIGYAEREEKHSIGNKFNISKNLFEQKEIDNFRKNNFYSKYSVSIENLIPFTNQDEIGFNLSYSIFRYDTPSNLNSDERDEQFFAFNVSYGRKFSERLLYRVSFESIENHFVYLLSDRSSNNYRNKIYKLDNWLDFQNTSLGNKSYFNILANYIIYDFENLIPNLKSFSLRQITFTDSAFYKPSKIFKFYLNISYKISEQGYLNWNDFKIRPQRQIDELFFETKLGLSIFHETFLNMGIFFSKYNEYGLLDNTKTLKNYLQTIGITSDMYIDFYRNLKMKFKINYEFIKTLVVNLEKNVNFNLSLNYEI